MSYTISNDFPEHNCATDILAKIIDLNAPNIPTFAHFMNWQQFTNYTEETLENMLLNGTYNSSHTNQEGRLVWPLDTNGCQACFLDNTKAFRISRPDPRYTKNNTWGGNNLQGWKVVS